MLDFARSIKRDGRPVTVLDIGCGDGLKIGALLERGLFDGGDKVIGLDINATRVGRVKSRYPQLDGRVGDAATLDGIDDGSCDGVIASALIEHVEDPSLFMRNLRRVLRPGGKAYISSLVRRKHIVWYYRNRRGEFARDPEHVHEWRSDREFQDAVGGWLEPLFFRRSPFTFTAGCLPLLMRRMGLLGDAAAGKLAAACDRALPWIRVPDPFFHRVEIIAEKA
jgi:SAM-dependent methyltransferase